MYYLQSRYYDPEVGRFVNADAFTSTGQGIIGCNMFAYCGNNPVCRIDFFGNDWETWLQIGTVLVVIGAVLAFTIGSGGTGALALAGMGISASMADASVFTGLAIAGSSVLVAATENINKDYIKAKNNKTANEWAKEVGAEDAESLKEEYVGRGNGTLFNMFKNKKTGQIVLKGIRIAAEIATDYYLNTKK